jgi:hypothetical protein
MTSPDALSVVGVCPRAQNKSEVSKETSATKLTKTMLRVTIYCAAIYNNDVRNIFCRHTDYSGLRLGMSKRFSVLRYENSIFCLPREDGRPFFLYLDSR